MNNFVVLQNLLELFELKERSDFKIILGNFGFYFKISLLQRLPLSVRAIQFPV